jgi:hypothetical protein
LNFRYAVPDLANKEKIMSKIIGFALAATVAVASTSAMARDNQWRANPDLNPGLYSSKEYASIDAAYSPVAPVGRQHGDYVMPFTWTEKRSFDRAVGAID